MKNLVFSSGQYRVDAPGATIVVAQNLFYESPDNLSGAIIGPGKFSDSERLSNEFYQIDTLTENMRKTAYLKQLSRFRRFYNYHKPNFILTKMLQEIDNKISDIADCIAARQLEILLKNNVNIEFVVGLAGLSPNVGRAAKKYGLKYGLHSQFCHPNFQNEQLENAYHSLKLKPPAVSKRKLERQLETLELADFIWCPSEFVQNSLISNGISKEKTFVNYLGVPIEKFKPFAGKEKKEGIFTILFIGNVGIQKGIQVLLEAVELTNIDQMEIIFNGGADPLADIIIESFRTGFSNKKIRLSVDPGDPRRHFEKADIFVLPSVHDSFGISVLEAMAAGLPVIVSDHVGAKEIVKDGGNGFIFSSGNSHELAENIEFFYNNPEKIREFGNNSAEIGNKFDFSIQGKKLEAKIMQGSF